MIVPADALFRRERDAHGLRMHCEDCALFDEAQPERSRCAHGYPTEPHRRPSTERGPSTEGTPITFCKDFEAC